MIRSLLVLFLFAPCLADAQEQAHAADTIPTIQLKAVQVKARFMNDTQRYRYNQMRFYVSTILPYVNAAARLFNEINAKTQDPTTSRKERRQFISSKEDEM